MPHIITVWCKDPLRPIDLNRDRTISVRLGDYPREGPYFEDLWIHFDPVEQLWFAGFLPFLRLSDVEVKYPDGRVDRFASPGTLVSCRTYQETSKEEAQALALYYRVALPSDLSSAATKPKRSRKTRQPKKPARPKTLRELVARLRAGNPRKRNVPGFLALVAEQFDQLPRSTSEVTIHFDDIRLKCHIEKDVHDETIETRTLTPARRAIAEARLPFRVIRSGCYAVVQKTA
jgi:hypothetical protein